MKLSEAKETKGLMIIIPLGLGKRKEMIRGQVGDGYRVFPSPE